MILFGSGMRSYRELPIRYAESSTLHRDERSGTLHGLLRVRHITQDDAHIFCTDDQIQDEIHGMVEYANHLYGLLGVTPRAELSTRPEKRLGTEDQWDRAESALEQALQRHGMDYVTSPGEGTFYGPKIDLHMTDSIGRSWQMGTIQLDYQMPARFGLSYVGADGQDHTPVVIHRALLGSLERCIGILTEHYAGHFPLWLAPVQCEIVPVQDDAPDVVGYANRLREVMRAAGIRATVSDKPGSGCRRASATPSRRRCRMSWSSAATTSSGATTWSTCVRPGPAPRRTLRWPSWWRGWSARSPSGSRPDRSP